MAGAAAWRRDAVGCADERLSACITSLAALSPGGLDGRGERDGRLAVARRWVGRFLRRGGTARQTTCPSPTGAYRRDFGGTTACAQGGDVRLCSRPLLYPRRGRRHSACRRVWATGGGLAWRARASTPQTALRDAATLPLCLACPTLPSWRAMPIVPSRSPPFLYGRTTTYLAAATGCMGQGGRMGQRTGTGRRLRASCQS